MMDYSTCKHFETSIAQLRTAFGSDQSADVEVLFYSIQKDVLGDFEVFQGYEDWLHMDFLMMGQNEREESSYKYLARAIVKVAHPTVMWGTEEEVEYAIKAAAIEKLRCEKLIEDYDGWPLWWIGE